MSDNINTSIDSYTFVSLSTLYVVFLIIVLENQFLEKLIYCLQANVSPNEVSGEWSERKSQVHLAAGHSGIGRLPV